MCTSTMSRPTTRSISTSNCQLENIRWTLDPVQVTFSTSISHLPIWRSILNTRYVGKYKPYDISTIWTDFASDNKTKLNIPIVIQPSLPPRLHNTLLQIYIGEKKLLTIRIFYTTGTVLIQGHACQEWVDEEFNKLKGIVNTAMASNTPTVSPPLDGPSSPLSCPALLPRPTSPEPDADLLHTAALVPSKDADCTEIVPGTPIPVPSCSNNSPNQREATELPSSPHVSPSSPHIDSTLFTPALVITKAPPPLSQLSSMATIASYQKQLSFTYTKMSEMQTEISSLRSEIIELRNNTQSIINDHKVQIKNDIKIIEQATAQQIGDTLTQQKDLRQKIQTHSDQLQSLKDHLKKNKSIQQENKPMPDDPSKSPRITPRSGLSTTVHDKESNITSPAADSNQLTYAAAVKNRFAPLAQPETSNPTSQPRPKVVSTCTTSSHVSTVKALDCLRAKQIPDDCDFLLVGDSVLSRVSEEKLSQAHHTRVTNIAVPGLTIEHLHDWLKSLSPVQHVKRIVFHVGINSCFSGPVDVTIWRQLIAQFRRVFPSATLQASSIIPPRGKHPLKQPASVSTSNLRQACTTEVIELVDHTPTFLTLSGAPKKALYWDSIHPSVKGTIAMVFNLRHAGVSSSPRHPASSLRAIYPEAPTRHRQREARRPALNLQQKGDRRPPQTYHHHIRPSLYTATMLHRASGRTGLLELPSRHQIIPTSPLQHRQIHNPNKHALAPSSQYEDISSDEELELETHGSSSFSPKQAVKSKGDASTHAKDLIQLLIRALKTSV